MREDRLREKQEPEPVRCPKCGMIVAKQVCQCGYEFKAGRKSRPVIQSDGTMKEMAGDIYKPRRVSQRDDAAQLWERMYYRAKSKKWNATFRQAEAMFAQENHWAWPSHELPLMPIDPQDFFRKVADVPMERLRPRQMETAHA